MEYDFYRIKSFDIAISLSTKLNVTPGIGDGSCLGIQEKYPPLEIPEKYIGPSCIDYDNNFRLLSYAYKVDNDSGGIFKITVYKANGEKLDFPSINGNIIDSMLTIELGIESMIWRSKELQNIKGFWLSFIINDINIKSYYIPENRFHSLITLTKEGYSEEVASFKLRIKISDIFQNSDEIRQMYRKNLGKQLEIKGHSL